MRKQTGAKIINRSNVIPLVREMHFRFILGRITSHTNTKFCFMPGASKHKHQRLG